MNFILDKSAYLSIDKAVRGMRFLKMVVKGKWRKGTNDQIKIMPIERNNDLGYLQHYISQAPFDLLFTRQSRKDLGYYMDKSIVRMIRNIAQGELQHNGRLRKQGAMQSLTIPGTRQQKVLLFTTLYLKYIKQAIQILVSVDDAKNWNSHGRNRSIDYNKMALARQRYYRPIYQVGCSLDR